MFMDQWYVSDELEEENSEDTSDEVEWSSSLISPRCSTDPFIW